MTVPRVLFGSGTVDQVPAEVERLSGRRALVLSGPVLAGVRAQIGDLLGPLAAAAFGEAAMHTPVEVTNRALDVVREQAVDCLVAVGGGSTVGLSKALALHTDLPQVVLPTTYAGSEVTPVLGQTEGGAKRTLSSPAVLPETVIYDVDLTLDLPVRLSVQSGMNALAHAVEALYAPQAGPIIDELAVDAIERLASALPIIVLDPVDEDARTDLLYAAYLAGTCLALVGMGLHHKLCHVLGGSFGLPHAATHTVVLPYAMAYNAPAVPEAMRLAADALGVADAPAGLYDLVLALGGPVSLREIGLAESSLPRAAELATTAASTYANPREPTYEGVLALLRDAWAGTRPA